MRRVSLVLLAALAVAGCKKQQPTTDVQQQPAAQAGASAAIQGKVLERLDAPPDYSYLRLETAKGETWAAVPRTEVAVGSSVTVTDAMPMNGFESKTLNRKFDLVYFGKLQGDAGAPPAGPMGGAMAAGEMPPGHPQTGGAMGGAMGGMPGGDPTNMAAQHKAAAAGPADVGDVKVPKASGADARTVAEVWTQRAQLAEKPVTVRGKVVKFNGGIMGKNWVHLRDGTGTAGKDNDVTVTTSDVVAVGDVVVAKGTVRVDKDFGAGYAYPVIIEDAKLAK